uniref:Uncharacterized protein n=1 Tax=Oryza barthii TaxID=65489 RepID=A0A0D3HLF7_9ORYZ
MKNWLRAHRKKIKEALQYISSSLTAERETKGLAGHQEGAGHGTYGMKRALPVVGDVGLTFRRFQKSHR